MTQNLKDLQLSDFDKAVGTDFYIYFEDEEHNKQTYTLSLLEAVGVGDKERDIRAHGRESFSLIFINDDPTKHLIQQIYELHHDELGVLHLFLVPLGIVDDKVRYEVIFT